MAAIHGRLNAETCNAHVLAGPQVASCCSSPNEPSRIGLRAVESRTEIPDRRLLREPDICPDDVAPDHVKRLCDS